ncbi:MAG: hypothetical protein HYS98_01430 [Deltaproteobacteria bacterium]|nr:hypothetical protein [Deltaproteobacteria bacterium]
MKQRDNSQSGFLTIFFLAIGSLLLVLSVRAEVSEVVANMDQAEAKAVQGIEAQEEARTVIVREVIETKKQKSPLYITMQGGQNRFGYKNNFIDSKYSAGVALGVKLFSGLAVEGEFQYSHYELPKGLSGFEVTDLRDNRTGRVLRRNVQSVYYNVASQYRGSGGLKYRIFEEELVSPFVTGGVSILKSQAKMTNGTLNQGARESKMETALAGQLGGGLEVNLGSIKIGAGVKLFKHMSGLDKPSWIDAWKKRHPHPADLNNQKEFFEVLGTVSFDL